MTGVALAASVYGMDGELIAEIRNKLSPARRRKSMAIEAGSLLVTAQPNSGNANVQWLVTDHLGTPRMIVDKSGTLESVSRHDYLPFGEDEQTQHRRIISPFSPDIISGREHLTGPGAK